MTGRPSIGVITGITNPLSTSYFSYLAFVETWSKVATQVILVDGGSTDESLRFLEKWAGNKRNVHVIQSQLTYWGDGDKWHGDQLGINLNVGLAALTTDWGFVVGADHVLDIRTTSELHQELADLQDIIVATNHRGKPDGTGIRHRIDARSFAINLRLIRSQGFHAVIGVDANTGLGSDWPLCPSEKSAFRDPITGAHKCIFAGQAISVGGPGKLSAECISYGHFFFRLDQCLRKVRRWDRAQARFLGIAPKRDMELDLLNGLYSIKGFRSKEEVMGWDHPPEILRVIERFYEPGMLGGAIREISPVQQRTAQALRKLLGLERHLRTRWLRARGYRGLKELHHWVPLDAPDPEPLDVRKAYEEQDKYLPPQYRVDWNQTAPAVRTREATQTDA